MIVVNKSIMNLSRVLIIAEAGVNHNGDVNIAKQLIDAAAGAGVDYVKFQTWITEDIIDINAPKALYQIENDGESSQYEMLKRLELSFDDFRELKKHCELVGVNFLSTPDDYKSLDFLCDDLKLPLIKVGSGEVTNLPYLKRIGKKQKDVILSTGMATIGEVRRAYDILINSGANTVSLLHCTSNYPASYDSVNLKAMITMRDEFNVNVGYSDHTIGNEISVAAVAMGAQIIEKHFTLDKNMAGPDHKASIDPIELRALVREIRNVESALSGDGIKRPHKSETETKKVVSRGIYLSCDVNKGEVLEDHMLIMKRPVFEISADMYDTIIGKKVKNNLIQGQALKQSDIE